MYRITIVVFVACLNFFGPVRAQQNPAVELEQTLQDVCGGMELWPGYMSIRRLQMDKLSVEMSSALPPIYTKALLKNTDTLHNITWSAYIYTG
jgi:hypothetical protein